MVLTTGKLVKLLASWVKLYKNHNLPSEESFLYNYRCNKENMVDRLKK